MKESETKIKSLEIEFKNQKNHSVNKEKELESLKNDLEAKIAKNQEKLDLAENNLAKKAKENESIKAEYEEKIEDTKKKLVDLESRNRTLEAQILDAVRLPKILKDIRNILVHKGFISEKEFEDIMKQK